ncbi:amino acid adenylation domain-containing protein [Kitasatospora sp. NPDC127059]|uniref:amino acid adenylation domain-containing protein n=1 Tax=unclassified Kitasatospora TaxID=2633591 RepID=UPI00364FE739
MEDVEDVYELSPLQQGMLLHSLYGGDGDTYVAQHSFVVDGELDVEALHQAWRDTVAAHTVLRSSFHWEGLDKPLQVVHRQVPVELHEHDWSGVEEQEAQRRLTGLLARERTDGFDLARAPLLRLHLVRHEDRRHTFVWTHHMLPTDGWSVPIVIGEIVRRYRSLTAGYPPPAPVAPYRDYIAWLQRQDLAAAEDFWAGALGGEAEVNPLGPLLPDRSGGRGARVEECVTSFPADLRTALRGVAARGKVTFNTVLQAAWALVLQRFTGGTEVQFGFASSGRPPELPGVDRMVGSFVNSLPLRLAVPADGDLGEWLRAVQVRHSTTRRYEYSPLAQIKSWAGVPATQELFDSLLVLENYRVEFESGELAQRLSFRGLTDFEKTSEPLTVFVTAEPHSVLKVLYHRDRIPAAAVEEILGALRATLVAMTGQDRIGAIVAEVADAGPDDPSSRGAVVAYPDAGATLPELILRQAAATPDAVAVSAPEGALSYRQLLDRARDVAAALAAAGAGPGQLVGVCAERSLDLVVNLVGTLLSGAAYLPLDPSLPAARLAFIRGDAGADVVLASAAGAAAARTAGARLVLTPDLVPPAPEGWRAAGARGADAAYVIHTSGSTGRPKGVVITHEAVVNRLLWMQEAFELTPADRVLQKTPFGFDVSVWELFWPLITGATLVVARPGGHQDAAYLARTIADQGVTTAHFVPSMLQLFLDEPDLSGLSGLRQVMCSGEALPHALAGRFHRSLPGVRLHNLYGPTEAAVDVTWWDCGAPGPEGVLPIGGPIANTRAHVLDHRLREVPRMVPGELYLGGVQLARGYLGRPGLTAATFVAHPLAGPGGRLYRTGDKVRRLPDGSLEFLGRIDHQVKIHGYRIELGEIEQALVEHPAVREAVVVVRSRGELRQLAAYVTAAGTAVPVPEELRAHLRDRLPGYMLPATVTVLPAMPLTHNGKLDRAALPDPGRPASARRERVALATPREEAVAEVFRDVLGVPEVDASAHFFDLGGTSFDAVRAVRRIEGATVADITAHPTIRALAAALDATDREPGMLLRLTAPRAAGHTLVCVPFGGGSAIAYRALADALSPDIALHAVVLPGHEPGGTTELRSIEDTAGECAEAVLALPAGPVSLYGHCAGVAVAVEVARRLEEAGRPLERLFLGASYPFYEAGRWGRTVQRVLAALARRGLLKVSVRTVGATGDGRARSDLAEMRFLRSIGGFANDVDEETLAFVMRAFRHDVTQGAGYFTRRWSRRAAVETPGLSTPITFVAGSDDPLTPRPAVGVRGWERFSGRVELATVPGGRHYFLQEQPEVLAAVVEAALDRGGPAPSVTDGT